MRIVVLSADDPYIRGGAGGKHVHIKLFIKGLKKNGYKTILISPHLFNRYVMLLFYDYIGGIFSRILKNKNLAYLYRLYVVKYLLLYKFKTKVKNFDYIVCEDILSIEVANMVSEKKKIFAVIHGPIVKEAINHHSINPNIKFPSINLMEKIEKSSYKKVSKIIAVDNNIKEYIASFNFPEEKIYVVYNAIDTDRFRLTNQQEKIEIRKRLNFSEKKVIALIPRRLVKKNGVIYAVKSLAYIKTNFPEDYKKLVFIIAGDGPERKEIEQLKRENNLENLHMLGYIAHDKIVDYFKMSDIVIIPSIYSDEFSEATSLSALEGLATKNLVIASRVGGLKEIIKCHETGVLVEDKNVEELGNKILDFVNNKDRYTSIIERGARYCQNNHRYDLHAKKIAEILFKE
ncbi:hypothetical protein DRN58_02460 [Thermococci archaeon]|nr:MAG: hypothetical protein DRN58_02460 [Thermococci archaeon]